MAQGDYLIQNQSFPAFRSDLNTTLEAINTSNSGTSRPSSAVAGTIWLDTTSATSPTLKFYDGAGDISLATLDYSANTVNWLDSTVVADLVGDTSPQLGGNLDVNGNAIVSASNGNITFTPNGSGKVIIDGLSFPTSDGSANQVLKTDGSGNLSFTDAGGGAVSWQTGSIKTATFTASAGEGYFCNTAGGSFEVDLPAGSPGSIVAVQDYNNTFDSNSITVDPNGSEKINGGDAGETVELSTEGQGVAFVYVDATVGWRSIQDNSFAQTGQSETYITATGGTITTVCTNYKVHTFTSPGTFTVCSVGNCAGSNTVSYTVVAGGGGGAFDRGGGGGAGGFREGRTPQCTSWSVSPLNAPAGLPVSAQGYPITVGGGGSAGSGPGPNSGQEGNTGSNTIFSSITSNGGGSSGNGNGPERDGGNGGSGGGGGSGNDAGGTAGNGNTPPVSPAQGLNGGPSTGSTCNNARLGGGGGGATTSGTQGNFPAGSPGNGNGGTGATNSINATPTARAGGGGGGKQGNPGSAGSGGTGGGGTGGKNGNPGSAGSTNTGGGGGGGGSDGNGRDGGNGGSGVVIIRYRFQ